MSSLDVRASYTRCLDSAVATISPRQSLAKPTSFDAGHFGSAYAQLVSTDWGSEQMVDKAMAHIGWFERVLAVLASMKTAHATGTGTYASNWIHNQLHSTDGDSDVYGLISTTPSTVPAEGNARPSRIAVHAPRAT